MSDAVDKHVYLVWYILGKIDSLAPNLDTLITRSPIYTHFSESISGAPTIRAYGRDEDFIMENETRIDSNQMCYYPGYTSSRWLSVRLEIIGNIILMFAALFAVLSKGSIDAGSVGLTLSYAFNVTGTLNMLVRMSSEVSFTTPMSLLGELHKCTCMGVQLFLQLYSNLTGCHRLGKLMLTLPI